MKVWDFDWCQGEQQSVAMKLLSCVIIAASLLLSARSKWLQITVSLGSHHNNHENMMITAPQDDVAYLLYDKILS